MIYATNKFNSYNNNNLAFGNLKSNLRLGEKELKQFKSEYPYLKSSSFIAAKIQDHKLSKPFAKIIKKLKDLEKSYDFFVTVVRHKVDEAIFTNKSWIEELKNSVKKWPYANCGEQTDLIFDNFDKSKVKLNKIVVIVEDKKKRKFVCDHSFLVFGIKNGGKIKCPQSWGNETVIVDPWLNFVKPKDEGLEYIKQRIHFDNTKHNLIFDYDPTE